MHQWISVDCEGVILGYIYWKVDVYSSLWPIAFSRYTHGNVLSSLSLTTKEVSHHSWDAPCGYLMVHRSQLSSLKNAETFLLNNDNRKGKYIVQHEDVIRLKIQDNKVTGDSQRKRWQYLSGHWIIHSLTCAGNTLGWLIYIYFACPLVVNGWWLIFSYIHIFLYTYTSINIHVYSYVYVLTYGRKCCHLNCNLNLNVADVISRFLLPWALAVIFYAGYFLPYCDCFNI